MAVINFTIATEAEKSPDFRRVLWTGEHSQLVIMTIPPDGEIGEEVHEDIDQILTFVSGLIVGALGRLAIPGRDPMSIPMTIAVGVAASWALSVSTP